MAQVNYFMTDAETMDLMREILDSFKACFTPERYSTPKFPTYTTLEELVAQEEDEHFQAGYFITSELWGLHPFHIRELQHPTYPHFYLFGQYGGPHFIHTPSRFYTDGPTCWIVPGMFNDYPNYFCARDNSEVIVRPDVMKKAFQFIKRFILKGSVKSRCVEEGFEGPHITKGALHFFEKGGWLRIGDLHFEPVQ